jgi:hypothetical protein
MIYFSTEPPRSIGQSREMISHEPIEVGIKAMGETCDKLGRASQMSSSLDCGVVMALVGSPRVMFSLIYNCTHWEGRLGRWALGLTESGKWV